MDVLKTKNLKINTTFVDDFSKEVYEQTYKYGNEDINNTQARVANYLAEGEVDIDYWSRKFGWALEDFKFVPGGRITSNAGTGLKGTSMINCFVDGFMGEDQDSMEGILDALRRQALILKSEGGYGFCSDVMRPRGAFINGIGNESPGSIRMLDMWDTQSAVITEGSGQKTKKEKAKVKIRKGAQMVTMSCFSDTTLILTDKGWINIVELIKMVEDGIDIKAICDKNESHKIFDPIVREPEQIYELTTESGDVVEVTEDHQFEIKNIKTGEIYLKALKDIDLENEEIKIIKSLK